jgi:DHA2 family multidrug resistance protein
MLLAGRLINRVGPRILLTCGFGLTVLSLWQMAGYNLQMSESTVIWSNLVQGIGLGFITVPLMTAAFFTLDPVLRPEGTSIYSLSRNLGSSIGISWMQTLLTRNTVAAHSSLVEHVTLYSPQVALSNLPAQMNLSTPGGLGVLEAEVTRQASMIGYVDDFKLMMVMTAVTIPLILLMRMRNTAAARDAVHVPLE